MKVSTIITTYNSGATLDRAIKSILDQTTKSMAFSNQIIVVDDGSTDDTVEVLGAYKDRPSVETIFLERNFGVSHARNAGLDSAKGDFIRFLDADDELLPKTTQQQIDFLKKNPAIDLVFCDCQVISWDGSEKLWSSDRPFTAGEDALEQFIITNRICLHCALLRKKSLGDQRFDESLRNAEDHDFWLNLLARGKQFGYQDFVGGNYHRSKNSLSRPSSKAFYNNQRVLIKLLDTQPKYQSLLEQQIATLDGILAGFYLLEHDNKAAKQAFQRASKAGALSSYKQFLYTIFRISPALAGLIHQQLWRVKR